MLKFRRWALALAESIDAWRIVPRMMLIAYGYLVLQLFLWFKSIPLYVQTKCDAAVLQLFLDKGVALLQAKELACSVAGTVGGPTAEQTAFVTTIVGLSTAIFAFYTGTGRKWQKETPDKGD